MSAGAIPDDTLHAYLDGQLDRTRAAAVDDRLRGDAAAEQRVHEYRCQRELLHTLFDPVLQEGVPPALLHSRTRFDRGVIALGLALLVVGAGAGWWLRGDPPSVVEASLPRQAAVAHAVYTPEVRHAVEVGARDEVHLVAWLSKRLGTTVRAPKLMSFGFELLGGRLLPVGGKPGAQFMYQHADGRRLTLYVGSQPSVRETHFRYVNEGGVRVFYWVNGELAYALSGELEKPALARIAHAVYQQLSP